MSLSTAAFGALLVLIAAFGGIGAYIAMVLALPVLVLVLVNPRWFGTQDGSFPLLFGLALAIFAVLVVIPGRAEGSVILVLDFLPFGLAIGLYVGLCRLKPETLLSLVSHGALAGAALSFAVGAYQILGANIHRAEGISGMAIHYANISLLLGFLALASLFSPRSWRWYFAIGPFLAIGAALMSGSRSMILVGMALSSVLILHLFVWYKGWKKIPPWRMAALAIAVIALIFVVLALNDTRQVSRITALFAQAMEILRGEEVGNRSIAIRLDYYQGGLKAFLDRPFFGYGWHEAAFAAAPFMNVYDPTEGVSPTVRHLHNDLLQFAVCFGIPGVLAYLLVLCAPVITWLRNQSRQIDYASYSVFAVVSSYVAMGLTNTTLLYEQPKVMFCFACAGVAALAARRKTV